MWWWMVVVVLWAGPGSCNVLTPPYINIAENSEVSATYTCGEGIEGTELYCKLVGANQESNTIDSDSKIIQGQVCDICNVSDEAKAHPPSFAVDGSESYWMSPPLSRGMEYSQVNFTINLGQEFHVAYIIIKMGISPRPAVWVLERSSDNGKTYTPWQYFADSEEECERLFGPESLEPITRDDSVICDTRYSKIIPLEDGEIVVSLLNGRPSAHDFFNSTVLQEWTRATNVRLRLLQIKTLFAHVMSFARQDPSVTRRYFYSIRDISIGGRCRCNGHADVCVPIKDSYTRACECKHNTAGINCEKCLDNLVQKKWRQSKSNKVFECEECNCHGHTNKCVYNETVDALGLSLDKYGKYEGGGVCQDCQDNTMGINCEKCLPGFYRPTGRLQTQKDACAPCRCNEPYHTGNCAEGTGICECKVNFEPPFCDKCAYGYFGFPTCKNCTCFINGTEGGICEPDLQVSTCTCKPNFDGIDCRECHEGYYNFPECTKCECHPVGSLNDKYCNVTSGQCECRNNFGGLNCNQCAHGFFDFPLCTFCKCDPRGTVEEVCDKRTGQCLCKDGFGGERCDKCIPGYKDHPDCKPCGCSDVGSTSKVCDVTGKCSCLDKFSGKTCSQCAFGYYKYPECLPCNCETQGTIKNAPSCDDNAQCKCREGIEGKRCDTCKEGLYNFPTCEECNCDPAGSNSSDCGALSKLGELCQCKPRVTGRTCKECKPLYWNLQHYNPLGCEECGCSAAGVVGGVAICDTKSGQCLCKQNVEMRQCDTCKDGSYNLQETNIFGCTDCSCDIGGALDNICNKETGACSCRPRITGRKCNEPMIQHYFPTLHQFKYELEDGMTPDQRPLSYGYEESVFPDFSWRGYAIFTHVQNTVKKQVELNSDMLHYIVMRYVNRNEETIPGTILVRHEEEEPIERKIFFKRAMKPAFAFAAGAGNIAHPLIVTSQGKWDIEITVNQSVFIDYFVLIPQSYYEGNILIDAVREPCKRGEDEHQVCKQYAYPSVDTFDIAYGDNAFMVDNGVRKDLTDFMEDWDTPMGGSKISLLPELSPALKELRFDLRVRSREPSFLVINYATPHESNSSALLTVDIDGDLFNYSTDVQLSPCPYTWLCRHALLDKNGKIAVLQINEDLVTVTLMLENEATAGIESVSLVPYDSNNAFGYLKPSPVCISMDGKCRASLFETPLHVKKVEFESGNEGRKATTLPRQVYDNNTVLVYLDKEDPMIDLAGKVPSPGNYTFIVHYYQPNHPAFDLDVLIHNGNTYQGKLPLVHCPSSSGCRSVVKLDDGKNSYLTESFFLTLQVPNDKNVWLDYILVLPDSKFSQHLTTDKQEGSIERFLKECSGDSYYADNTTSEFCRSSIFSLTAHYNNGALKCDCHTDGAFNLLCEKFGGQCKCRPNIIGRRCERCKTGYYQFPYCKPCDCPENSLCDELTGMCSCPPNVVGELCDECANNTYGYFPQLGCRECECNLAGLEGGNLQCDPTYGTCNCKEHVIGRQCDSCEAGYYLFPKCFQCDCDPRGTTMDICNNETGACICKENVEAEVCDICREGSFNLQGSNRQGCTKCFCFEHSRTCTSSRLYKAVIENLENWNLSSIVVKKPHVEITPLGKTPELIDDSLGVYLNDDQSKIVYYSAPQEYLGNRLTSYGGKLSYNLITTSSGPYEPTESAPDVVLVGSNFILLHFSSELPSETVTHMGVEISESNFILSNNFLHATRAQLMQVLRDLRAVYIKATFWKQSSTTRLSEIQLDAASDEYSDRGQALSVEQCYCEPQYTGLSCEDCAPGYYRSNIGPYGGNCIPCQCHGHAATCDKQTGICIDCQHNTTGDHCEKCAVGYHGDARDGTPYDCIICACPLPTTSNNFALSCEFSRDGLEISCNCKEGYFGSRCESCAIGYYGTPETEGDGECKPCHCSGNIDPNDVGACDSVTGECLKCLNNTFGDACGICAPFYYGDAVYLKNCQSCLCDKCGSEKCDHLSGLCECRPNVTGENCDKCIDDHYGLHSCQGCQPCNCGVASLSTQCDPETGNCKCKPGVTGRACDRCDHGYWNYTSEGCTLCSCNTGYSVGVGCNPMTGKCECLPGVIGEKCDHCPHRWVLKQGEGCLECDKCIDDLLDTTDLLHNKFGPFAEDFLKFNESFFTRQRVIFINQTVNSLYPNVSNLESIEIDFVPVKNNLNSVVDDVDKLTRRVEYYVGKTNKSMDENLINGAKMTEDLVRSAIEQARKSVQEVTAISESFKNGAGANYGYSGAQFSDYLDEAKRILNDLLSLKLNYDEEGIRNKELARAESLLEEMKKIKKPVDDRATNISSLGERIKSLEAKLDDLNKHSELSLDKAKDLKEQTKKYRDLDVAEKIKVVKTLEGKCNETLKESTKLLEDTNKLLDYIKNDLNRELINNQTNWEDLTDTANQTVVSLRGNQDDLRNLVHEATLKAEELERQGEELRRLQSEYQHDTNAVQAHKNIVNTLRSALITADEAKAIADNASNASYGIGDKAFESKDKSTSLNNRAIETLRLSQLELEPDLNKAYKEIEQLEIKKDEMKADIDNFENLVNKALSEMGSSGTIGTEKAEEAALEAVNVQRNIKDIVEDLPQKIVLAKQVRDNTKDGEAAIKEATSSTYNVVNVIPNITKLVANLRDSSKHIERKSVDLKSKLDELKNQINKAREHANSIKVGIHMYPNATLELRNPPNLPEQGINNKVSVYFNTTEPNGLIFFLGNEAQNREKRSVKTGDFMALEIQNGNPKLTVDLGSGATSLICDMSVLDGQWYYALVERTGKSLRLTITRVATSLTCVREEVMKGNTAVLNLDKRHSKLFVGSLPGSFNPPPDLTYNFFTGNLEEFMIDDQLVGFWNFEKSENLLPAQERDNEKSVEALTGFRFNGEGYVVLNSREWRLGKKSVIVLRFKTFAPEGILFLAPNGPNFLSVELREGRVLFQYDLGDGPLILVSPTTCNDGEWHSVEATRYDKSGNLKVDGQIVDRGESPGESTRFESPEKVFIGGFPGEHNIYEVTESDFDGCIDEVNIDEQSVNLDKNLEAAGVIPGCPPKFASVVSFEPGVRGYVLYPNASAHHNTMELILRFKTSSLDGLLAYADYGEASASLALSGGQIVFKVGDKDIVKSESGSPFNDSSWHVVMATYDSESLQIFIDDFEKYRSIEPPMPIRMLHGNLYFGGVPSRVNAQAAISKHFSGCISDATLNGIIINFGNLTETPDAVVGKCVEGARRHPVHRPPTLPPPKATSDAIPEVTTPGLKENEIPFRPTLQPEIPTHEITRPDHHPECKLPLYPATPIQEMEYSSYKIEPVAGSRLEYSVQTKIRYKYEFSIDIKTGASEGLIFYVSDSRLLTDFVAVYISQGLVNYRFSCGSGVAHITSHVPVNDRKWHNIKFIRQGTSGTLLVDNEPSEGSASGSAKAMNTEPRYYVGGLDPAPLLNNQDIYNKVSSHLKGVTNSLDGCIKDFKLNNQPIGKPAKKVKVSPCDLEYNEAFFSPDGGYVKLVEKFKIGRRFEVELEVRPRALSGLLLSVHSREAYLVLELHNGEVRMAVDVGSGEITTSFKPTDPYSLCDGNWHKITGLKAIHAVTLAVDDKYSDPSIGTSKRKDHDTKHTLYLGGHPNLKNLRGVSSKAQYVGCIRNIRIKTLPVTIDPKNTVGNVTGGICPD